MADVANTTQANANVVHSALLVLASMGLTQFRYPPDCKLTNETSYDYIVIGGGTAGSILGSRLSFNNKNKVLLIEAGTYAPLESDMPATFTMLPKSSYDYDICSVNDGKTAQNLQDSCVSLTAGKMLGGSAALDHMIHVLGDSHDFEGWAKILKDDRWTFKNLLPYFKKPFKSVDSGLSTSLHGTEGMMKVKRQLDPANDFYLKAFAELNHTIVDDTTSLTSSLGFTQPIYTISDGLRQTTANCYLGEAKSRSNLCVALSTTATKILTEKGKAVGVQVVTSSGETLVLKSKKEVIVSAGAIGSPKLLMLSGIGPKSHLEELGIQVVADLPVGQNFMDHPSAVLLIQMEKSQAPAVPLNPYMFPVPTTTGYVALDSSQTYPDYQVINLLFPHDSPALNQLCRDVFKYSERICKKFSAANIGRSTLFVVHNLMMPKSRGKILLASSDPTVNPLVYTGTYSDESDLDLMTRSLEDFAQVLETKAFKNVTANFVDPGLCPKLSGKEYWKCYALSMSATMWHYAGTCAMGSVTDSEMRVNGVSNLRVVDASVMPTQVSGNIRATVAMMAERAAAFIRNNGCDLHKNS